MGLNIAGVVIDKNYQNNLSELENIIGEKLFFEKEITFEEASENWKEDSYCDIYFTSQGTFALMSFEKAGFDFYGENRKVFSFVLSEMTMYFSVNYSENGDLLRNILAKEDEFLENEGEPFDFEKEEETDDEDFNPYDKSELIYHLIEKTLGESFWDIDLGAKCYRYRFAEISVCEKEITETTSREENPQKPWWKFW